MKVKIISPSDMRPGDLWMGLLVASQNDPPQEDAGLWMSIPGRHGKVLFYWANLVSLIAAGNDTVERKPGKVEFNCQLACIRDHAYEHGLDGNSWVKVTLEPMEKE